MADAPPEPFVFNEALDAFLSAWRTASLATVDHDGAPHNANVQFAHGRAQNDTPGLAVGLDLDRQLDRQPDHGRFDLWWVSSAASAHSQHLAVRPRAAVTVYAHADTPDQIRGMQARGTVSPGLTPDAPGHDQALRQYAAKYPFVAQPPFDAAVARQALYRFRPHWIRWIDNRRGFGWKAEQTFGD